MFSTEINSFLSYLETEKRYSKHTVLSYNTDLDQFFDFIAQNDNSLTNISEINYQHIRTWITELIEQKISSRSVNRKLSALKSFFKFNIRKNLIQVNPLSKITGPKTSKRLPVFVDEHQMNHLFNEIKFDDDFFGMRDKLILDLFYQTGIRRSELVHLKESDIDFFNSTIKVLGKRNKERIIPISLLLKRNLKSYIEVKEEQNLKNSMLLVNDKGSVLNEQFIYKTVKKYLAQVTTINKKSPHVLRHTFATHLLNNGADIKAVKDLLGHSNLSATQVYTHNTIEKLKKTYKQAHPRGE